MDPDVLRKKLESLARCLERIRDHTPSGSDALATDYDTQDILILNLERTVQLCVDIGSHILSGLDDAAADSMASVFTVMAAKKLVSAELASRLSRAVGFRNIAVHEYSELDWNIVYAIITERLPDFYEFGAIILALTETTEKKSWQQ